MIRQIEAIAHAIPGIIRGINYLADQVKQLKQGQDQIMSELDDAKAAMTVLTIAVSAGVAELKSMADKIVALLGAPGGVDPAAVEDLAHQMQAQADAITAATAAAKAEAGV
jgi:hypothetical protein